MHMEGGFFQGLDMNILCTGDWHLADKTPENRIDDYQVSQYKKIKWILDLAEEQECRFILQPGDLFDHYRISDRMKSKYIRLFNAYDIPIYTVTGQHDLRYHNSSLKETPLYLMESSGVLKILQARSISNPSVNIFGAGWEQKIPEIKSKIKSNILITHRMVIGNSKLWHEQKDYSTAQALLRKNNFDLIVSGDNHKAFEANHESKTLLNCGSLMRSTSAQLTHRPRVYIYNTETNDTEKHYVPIEPIDKVISIKKIEDKKAEEEELNAFVEKLDTDTEITGLDFKKNMIEEQKKQDVEPEVVEIISDMMGDTND